MRAANRALLRKTSSVAGRHAIALLAFLASFLVRDLLNDWLLRISDRGLIIFLPAILLVTFFIGLGPAILTLLLSAVAAWYVFIPPYYSFALGIDGAVVLVTFIIGSGVGIALVHWLHISITAAKALAGQRETLIETDPNGILVVNSEGRIQLVNGQLTKLFGYRGDELIGQPVEKLLPERYRGGHVALRAEFSEQPTNRPMGVGRELYGLRKDDSEVPVEIGLASFMTEGEELILANVVDITERKQREQAQTTYLRMLDTSFDAIIVRDAQARITGWNHGAERLYGWTREEALGRVIHSLLQTKFPKSVDEILADMHRNGYWEGELIQTRKDGARSVVLSRWTPEWDAKNGQLVSILQTSMDITDRKQAEQAHQQLATIVEASRDAIWSWAIDGTITAWNGEAERMLGYTANEILGKSLLTLVPSERLEAARGVIAKLRRGEGYGPLETERVRKDGTRLHVELTVSPIRDPQGGAMAGATICRDITQRKQADAIIAADLRDMTLLNQLSNRLVREGSDHDRNLNAVVDTAIAITGADKGNLQLLDSTTGALTIAAQCGFEEPFLKFFASVRNDASACATAMRSGERVIVEDVQQSEIFAGQPSKDVLIDAGVCAVTSTPLLASTGNLLGMISTHFATPHRPNERELHLMDLLARQVADYLERKRADEIEKTLVREIEHRSNNLLAVIQTIASRSLSGNYTLAQAKETFEARLQALARTNRQLTKSNWTGANLDELVRLELQPFAERITVEGINVMIGPHYAQNFSLALHELSTNASKYGALSNGSGKVSVSWTITPQGNNHKLKFKWQESGGPPVVAPTVHGLGTTLIKSTFPNARTEYADEGLSCEIDIPIGEDEVPVPAKRQGNGEQKRYAEECLKIARSGTDERTRTIFSQMAQVWFRLAEGKTKSSDE